MLLIMPCFYRLKVFLKIQLKIYTLSYDASLTFNSLDLVRHKLVEDVVGSLKRLLGDDTSLFKQVSFNISTRELARGAEMNTDEFTLKEKNR